jgi:hypothetical protein
MAYLSKAHFLVSTQLNGNANATDRHIVPAANGFFGGGGTLSVTAVSGGDGEEGAAVMTLTDDDSQATPIPVASKIIKAQMSTWSYGTTNDFTVYLWRRTVPAGSGISQPMTLVGYNTVSSPTSSGWDQSSSFTFTANNDFTAGDWFTVSYKRIGDAGNANITCLISALFAEK